MTDRTSSTGGDIEVTGSGDPFLDRAGVGTSYRGTYKGHDATVWLTQVAGKFFSTWFDWYVTFSIDMIVSTRWLMESWPTVKSQQAAWKKVRAKFDEVVAYVKANP